MGQCSCSSTMGMCHFLEFEILLLCESTLSLCKWGTLLGVWTYLCTACTALENNRLGHSARETGQNHKGCRWNICVFVSGSLDIGHWKALVDKDEWKSLQRFSTRHAVHWVAVCSPVMSGDVRCTVHRELIFTRIGWESAPSQLSLHASRRNLSTVCSAVHLALRRAGTGRTVRKKTAQCDSSQTLWPLWMLYT